ncbi:hypothetical protein JCM10908_007244 [Rhodotorula pacifica]|uniref:O-methyltransferase n=1 Tax=Rhodotorula pacifica TaxID=1495444 RepID=UPI00317E422A
MPTYQTKTTGGTPITRAAALLETALASTDGTTSTLSPTSRGSSSSALKEAQALIAGSEDYLERNTSELIVPRSHAVSEQEVRTVWNYLLRTTQETDWVQVKDAGKTKYELGAGMCSGPYEAVVLQNLALLQRTQSVLEIGVFTGTATLALALLPSVKEVVALDIEPYLKETVEPYWARAGVLDKIDFRIAPALETLAALSEAKHAPFDLIFIDADKPSYKAYVQAVLDGGLLGENGVILADNTLYKGYPWVTPGAFDVSKEEAAAGNDFAESNRTNNKSKNEATAGIDDFNTFVRDHPDLETVMLPIRDGITIIRRRI